MKTSSARTKTSKKRSTADADHAMKIAFQELYNRAAEEKKAARARSRAEKWKQWQGAAKRFKGPSETLRLQLELRNIYLNENGYAVRFMRGGENFSGHFAGVTEESLSAAIRFRDEALKILGEKPNAIPPHVLDVLGLSAPVPGIERYAAQLVYKVSAKDGKPQKFSYQFLTEEDAYAAAIECVEARLKSK